jgi:predicted NAD/FAD-binding protein
LLCRNDSGGLSAQALVYRRRPQSVDEIVSLNNAYQNEATSSRKPKVIGNASANKRTVIVVGAGCAGITAALALKSRGYRPVLLEKAGRLGGMSHTRFIDGRPYELGTVFFSPWYSSRIQSVMKDRALSRSAESTFQSVVDSDKGRLLGTTVPWVAKQALGPRGIQELLKYVYLQARYNSLINSDRNNHIPTDLKSSFQEEFPCLAKAACVVLTGFGYGYAESISTFHVLKYLRRTNLQALITNKIFSVKEGNQTIWEQAAEPLGDVRTGVRIESIRRLADCVQVLTSQGTIEGESVVFAIAPNKAIELLADASSTERRLAAKVQTIDFRSYLVNASFPWNPQNKAVYIINNMKRSGQNRPLVFYYHQRSVSNIAVVYVIARPGTSDEEIQRLIKIEAAKLNGVIQDCGERRGERTIFLDTKHWDYFPTLSLDDIRNNVFEAFQGLQGKKRSYYVGQFWNFPSVEHSASNAEVTIKKYFRTLY